MFLFLQVRIKPQQTKFEVDLDIDTTSENYDQDREQHLQIEKQVSYLLYRAHINVMVSLEILCRKTRFVAV